jgi:4-amino-4-deoxy-L-arabinose transferase-like glycosyltransferase
MNRRSPLHLFVLIIALAAIIRLYGLGSNPPALFRDEAEKGYTAYSLLKTGGYIYFETLPTGSRTRFQSFPVFCDVFGVNTSAIYQYLDVPFVALLGLTEFATRAPAALAGILTVLITFFLARRIWNNTRLALIASLLLAISPWHVLFSRWALQGILVPLFVSAGLLCFLKGHEQRHGYWLLAAFLFAVSFYAYAVARLFAPLFLVLLCLVYRRELGASRPWALASCGLFLIVAAPVLLFTLSMPGSARFERISIFTLHFPWYKTLLLFVRNYVEHYSPLFLFFKGDALARHGVRSFAILNFLGAPFHLNFKSIVFLLTSFGVLYLFEAPFLIIGLIRIATRRTQTDLLLLGWLLLFPIGASMTHEGIPHALRSIVALPMPQLITAVGIHAVLERLNLNRLRARAPTFPANRLLYIILLCIAVVAFISVLLFMFNLFVLYPVYSAPDWQYGVKQALEFARNHSPAPLHIYVSGYITFAPYLVLFYEKIDPVYVKANGFQSLPYVFLRPGLDMTRFWPHIASHSLLILYPQELRDRSPVHKIFFPSYPKKPRTNLAFEIFEKQ